ncbi:hypothetical protein Csa_019209 [Cucumis sativus]|uniref:Uncharacterized protein n=1 Tax=Cucumis sativus TaxID=3659 RepID=A0A0A0LF41_CUCSA|nr:hypothetical protein Csa_019209 [Cucumis sativus]
MAPISRLPCVLGLKNLGGDGGHGYREGCDCGYTTLVSMAEGDSDDDDGGYDFAPAA